ncbi:hypothetical protein [Rhodalgimonas zhirmunskyi]|uniref:Uncharacterized protein n=1 Tax=Rhodalgimonas zhirmunskyi TaxID=2964767 RepID=A0AAJ1X4Y6_9RHOB|nr:hypothetical protein [Rhodoalgimonas zhirmunskyi]MDQ2094718.1 hypothetical protein [Rhodoalgimonas zhirmunskyi]
MKPGLLAVVIIGGFALGAGLSTLWRDEAPALDMTSRALDSFARACLPGAMGADVPTPEALGLTATDVRDGGDPIWIDPQAGALLRFSASGCSVRISEPDLVARIDMKALGQRLAARLATDLPALKYDKPDELNWPYLEGWASGVRGTDERWGVVLAKSAANADASSQVILSLTYPKR